MKKKIVITLAGLMLTLTTAGGAMAAPANARRTYSSYSSFAYCSKAPYFFVRKASLRFLILKENTGTTCPRQTTPTTAPAPTTTTVTTPAATTPAPTTTTTTVTTPATTAPAESGAASLGKQMLQMVNEDRAANGLAPLVWSDALAQGALAHSKDMSQSNYFSHTSPTLGGFSDRLRATGLSTLGAGENIALYGSIEKAQAGLMSSEGHRANILKSSYTHAGIGIVYNASKGAYYITQWFARMS